MAEPLTRTARDYDALVDELERYLPQFLPEIRDTGYNSVGRRYLRLFAGLVDDANFFIDDRFLERWLATCREMTSAIRSAREMGYERQGASGTRTTLTCTLLSGVAGPGGQDIDQWQEFASSSPPATFLATQAATIAEGGTSTTVPVVQGKRRTDVVLGTSDGESGQEYDVPAKRVELELVVVRVGAVSWTRKANLAGSGPLDRHYWLEYNEADQAVARFGDGITGRIPFAGSTITADYVFSKGKGGRVPAGEIQRVVGALASLVACTNIAGASGGSDGDSLADIKRKAPAIHDTQWRLVHESDAEALGLLVAGVAQLKSVASGSVLSVYVLPEGGAVASQALLDSVQAQLTSRRLFGGVVRTYSRTTAELLITAQVILESRSWGKTTARSSILAKLTSLDTDAPGLFHFSRVKMGPTNSPLTSIAAAMELADGVLEVDILRLTRRPSVTQSNVAAPGIVGGVQVLGAASSGIWVITALTSTRFQIAKSGAVDQLEGQVGVSWTSTLSEVTLVLGSQTDSLTPGDTWTFAVSPYRGNVVLQAGEVPTLRESDLVLDIRYSDEV
jgi:hypothetical protein